MDNIILTLLLFFIVFTFFFQVSKRDSLNKLIQIIIVLFLFWLFSLEIKSSADWDAYIILFENKDANIDYLFRFLSSIFKNLGLKFEQLYQFHIILISLLLINFIRKVNNSIFFVFGIYIILYFVPITNQIRYYLAFSLFLNGCYYLYIDKKIKLSLIIFTLAILSHSAILGLLLFVVFNQFSKKISYVKLLIISSLSLFGISFFLQIIGVMSYLEKYAIYFSKESTSSFLGGLFNIFPYIILLIFIYYNYQKTISKSILLKKDAIYLLLFKLTMYTIVFIPISFYFQILSHRYVFPFTIVWVCLYLYPFQYSKNHVKSLQTMWITLIVFFLVFFYNYQFSEYILGEKSLYLTEFIKSFNSIEYFK